jgi:cobalt-zinc-cadmium efflux system outer membrane protein
LAGKRGYRVEKAKFTSEAAILQVNDAIRQALLTLRFAYYDAVSAQEVMKISRENLKSYERLVELNKARFAAKAISGSELWRSQLAKTQIELLFNESTINYSQAILALMRAAGIKETISLTEKFLPSEFQEIPLTEIEKKAVELRPDLLVQLFNKKAAEANRNLQAANAFPNVSVGIDYSQSQGSKFYGLSAQTPLPVSDRNQGERQKADLLLMQTEKRIQMSMLKVTSEVEGAYKEFETRKASIKKFMSDGSDAILTQAENIKTAAEFAYKNGSISLLEYLDAFRAYSETFRTYIDSVTLYNKSIAQLKAAAGLDFEKTNITK